MTAEVTVGTAAEVFEVGVAIAGHLEAGIATVVLLERCLRAIQAFCVEGCLDLAILLRCILYYAAVVRCIIQFCNVPTMPCNDYHRKLLTIGLWVIGMLLG